MRSRPTALGRVCVLALAATILGGCDGAPAPRTEAPSAEVLSIEEVGQILRMYKKSGQGAPKTIKDVIPLANGYPFAVESLRKGDVVLYWGAAFDPDDSKTVLAYHKDVPTQGGEVLLRDGSAIKMTAEEFQSAPKPADGDVNAGGVGKADGKAGAKRSR
ncbi:hypothetical protein [Planctomyces sp. SH-PL62]|uniref:hypothetical protein n=1 Tax=Planctomyces sp. SH-PL62 TaxID=1636152 RepID=UPI00078BE02A|nr:hypothetical protein [Planctomyces sp. SH-PL62]AMV35963.1 hypothetical protein VT85_00865 [Planctomyces sp. SH-PL62]